jgi:hypothetical protein
METDTQDTAPKAQHFTPLELETRPTVNTAAAAHYLNRKPQTLRIWALTGHPIAPRKVHSRLAWSTESIRMLPPTEN